MQFIAINYEPWNLLIRKKGNKNYIIKAYHITKEELEYKYNNCERTRIYIRKSKYGIKKMTITFYRDKFFGEFSTSSFYIYTFKEITNEDLLELGCNF